MIQPCGDLGGYRKFWVNIRGVAYPEGFHEGFDFNEPVGTQIRSICEGKVIFANQKVNGFGALNLPKEEIGSDGKNTKPGGMVVVKHKLQDGTEFVALYGHIAVGVNIDDELKEGSVIGTINPFTSGKDLLPHLHLGINTNAKMPEPPYGYTHEDNKKGWVDPIQFLKNNK
jgi:murein DD-endopeptidase MepM/ murein hydrolase activator NlpD